MVLGQIQSGVGGGDAREWLEEGRRKCFNENYCTPFIYIYNPTDFKNLLGLKCRRFQIKKEKKGEKERRKKKKMIVFS